MKRMIFLPGTIFLIVMFLSACGSQSASKESPPVEAAATGQNAVPANVSFSGDIKPILDSRCAACHSGSQGRAGLDVTTYESLIAGSQNGAVIVPGDAGKSKLIALVTEGRMPKAGPKLTPEEIQLITDWVNAGAQNN